MTTVETIPVIEEELRVGKRQVETGRVRLETRTGLVEELAEAELASSEVEVTRVPVNRQVDRAPDIRTESDVTIVPVLEEVLVVEKRLVLKEELHIRRTTKTETFSLPVTLRKQRAIVTRNDDLSTRSEPMADFTGSTYSNRTITAFFDTRDDAQAAIDRLKGLGIPDGSVKLVRGDDETYADSDGGKGFWESLSDFFFPDDDRAAYAEGLRRGGFLVTATDIASDKYSEALDILDDEGSVDVDARSAEWRSDGWAGTGGSVAASRDFALGSTGVSTTDYSSATDRKAVGETDLGGTAAVGGYGDTSRPASSWETSAENTAREVSDKVSDWASEAKDTVRDWTSSDTSSRSDRDLTAAEAVTSSAAPLASDAARMDSTYDGTSARAKGDEEVIPVVEERLRVGKRDADLGRVRVRSYTVEEPVSESVNLHSERVHLDRRPVDRELSGSEAAFTDRTIEAREHTEEPVVSKDARVVEEIGLRREGEDRTETVSDTVRRTEVEIDDERNAGRRDGTTGTRLSDADR